LKPLLPSFAAAVLALSLTPIAIAFADQPSPSALAAVNNTSNRQGDDNFQYSGLRSNGFPVRNWADFAQGPASATQRTAPITQGDQVDGDLPWLRSLGLAARQAAGVAKSVVGGPAANPITCHGTCTTLSGNVSLIPVWVGAWAPADVTKWNTVLGNIVTSLGTAPANSIAKPGHVFNTNSLYFTTKGKVAPSLQWVNSTSITAPTAVSVTDANVATYINTFITANPKIVPAGTTPIYMYIGAKSTRLTSGFGTSYCGWHSFGTTLSLKNVQYLAIQDFTANYNAACAQQTISPNGSASLDAMASVLTHEIDETITDPFLNAWYDVYGSENADKCAWTFGATTTTSGYMYNIQLGSYKYLIQQNWLANNLITATGLSASSACSVTG